MRYRYENITKVYYLIISIAISITNHHHCQKNNHLCLR